MKIKTFLLFFVIVLTVYFVACSPASSDTALPAPAATTPDSREPALTSPDSEAPASAEMTNEKSPGEQPLTPAAAREEHSSFGGDEDGGNSRISITARVSDQLLQAAKGNKWTISITFSGRENNAEGGTTESSTAEAINAGGSTAEGGSAEGEVRFRRPANPPDSRESENSDNLQKETIYSLSLAPVQQTLHFPYGAVGFVPREILIEISSSAEVEDINLEADVYGHEGPAEEIEPLSADLGVILSYPKDQWRRQEYELFRWNLIPEVLIFDFSDYAVQRRYFTRLAFYVGVTGESGSIEEHSYYEGRHVFNAHDYRPEDLAAFFRQAETQGISLNKEERLVRDIALSQGVLRKKDGVISAGTGAILSTSQEIPSYLERRLLAHETIHGIFYAVSDFREGAFSIYKEMPQQEKEFWYSFLGNKGRLDNRSGYDGYDVENEYLLVNEIVGHMMQLQPHVVEAYFLDVYLPRLEELLPEKKSAFQNIRRDNRDMFARTRAKLEALLEKSLGLKRGNLFITEKITE